jgi:hypothetical protein
MITTIVLLVFVKTGALIPFADKASCEAARMQLKASRDHTVCLAEVVPPGRGK